MQLEKLMAFSKEEGAAAKRLKWMALLDFGDEAAVMEDESSGAESQSEQAIEESGAQRGVTPLGTYVVSIVGNSKTRTLQ